MKDELLPMGFIEKVICLRPKVSTHSINQSINQSIMIVITSKHAAFLPSFSLIFPLPPLLQAYAYEVIPLPNPSNMQTIIDHGGWDAAATNISDLDSSVPGTRKVKGISKVVTRKEMTITNYQDVLDQLNTQRHSSNTIRSHNHVIHIEEQEKTSLSILEDKRLV